jgi:hypothetical protein
MMEDRGPGFWGFARVGAARRPRHSIKPPSDINLLGVDSDIA